MNKKIVGVFVMTLILLTVRLSGCNENEHNENIGESRFVGTWTYTGGSFYNDIIVLYSDGVLSTTHYSSYDHIQSGTWEANETHLILHKDPSGQLTEGYDDVYSYSFSNSETLVLTRIGVTGTYKKS